MSQTQKAYLDRISKLDKIAKNKDLEALEKERCRRDIPYFISAWGSTYDPRNQPKHFPFVLFDFQIETVNWLEQRYKNKENGLIEKSRDLGITNMAVAWSAHHFLFDNGFSALFGSRKEALVDNFTQDSIFGKIRYFLYRLPKFLIPELLRDGSKWDRHMSIINPINGNQITGESTNSNFGRGGRSSICFIDEAAHIEHSEQIYAAISENSDSIISLSTPNGKSNMFAFLRFETKIPMLSLHWSRHPNKTKEWYEAKKAQMKPWQIGSELDLSYERSLEGRVHQRFDRGYHIAEHPIYCNPGYEQFVSLDFGIADPTAIIWGQITTEGFVEIWNWFEMSNHDIDTIIPIIRGQRPKEYALFNSEEKKSIERCLAKFPKNLILDFDCYGDNSGTARTANARRTCRDALAEDGIKLISTGRQSFDYRIECVDALLKPKYSLSLSKWYSIFQVSPDCERFIDSMFNYVYDSENINDNTIKPKHNEFSHLVTAFEFFVINRFGISKPQESYSTRIR